MYTKRMSATRWEGEGRAAQEGGRQTRERTHEDSQLYWVPTRPRPRGLGSRIPKMAAYDTGRSGQQEGRRSVNAGAARPAEADEVMVDTHESSYPHLVEGRGGGRG